jgi:hypothetical protein
MLYTSKEFFNQPLMMNSRYFKGIRNFIKKQCTDGSGWGNFERIENWILD